MSKEEEEEEEILSNPALHTFVPGNCDVDLCWSCGYPVTDHVNNKIS